MESIMQKDRYCYLCGKVNAPLECHHVLNGNPNRKLSEKYGLKVWLCPGCHRNVHSNINLREHLKAEAQRKAMQENHWNFDQWMEIFGKNYL